MVRISRLENKDPKTAERVRFYRILLCAEGRLKVGVDEVEFTLRPFQVLTLTSGQYHQIWPDEKMQGYVLDFSLDFFCKTQNDIELIFENGLFCHFGQNAPIELGPSHPILMEFGVLEEELRHKPLQYLVSAHARIGLILVSLNRAKLAGGAEIWKPNALFLQFLEQVRSHFGQVLSVAGLAEQLGTTEQKLNELARLHTGRTAQQVIHGLVVSEARRMLRYQNLRMKEVAYRLGYNDPYYFSRFFKTQTGESPSDFRKRVQS